MIGEKSGVDPRGGKMGEGRKEGIRKERRGGKLHSRLTGRN